MGLRCAGQHPSSLFTVARTEAPIVHVFTGQGSLAGGPVFCSRGASGEGLLSVLTLGGRWAVRIGGSTETGACVSLCDIDQDPAWVMGAAAACWELRGPSQQADAQGVSGGGSCWHL